MHPTYPPRFRLYRPLRPLRPVRPPRADPAQRPPSSAPATSSAAPARPAAPSPAPTGLSTSASSALGAPPGARMARVTFNLQYRVEWGQSVRLIGSVPALGEWSLAQGIDMEWRAGDNWVAEVSLSAPRVVEYKFVVVNAASKQPVHWMQGNNCVLALQRTDSELQVFENWTGAPGAAVQAATGPATTRESRLSAWADDMAAAVEVQKREIRQAKMELAAMREELRTATARAQQAEARAATEAAIRRSAEAGATLARREGARLAAQLEQSRADRDASMDALATVLGVPVAPS